MQTVHKGAFVMTGVKKRNGTQDTLTAHIEPTFQSRDFTQEQTVGPSSRLAEEGDAIGERLISLYESRGA